MDRTERQKLSVKRWIDSGGHGIIQAVTGYGKTRVAIMTIKAFLKRNPKFSTLIVVPTEVLKNQWIRELAQNRIFEQCKVEIINTTITHSWRVDFLILDEVHLYCSEKNIEVFQFVSYKYVMGLTATLERLDGRHELLIPYMSICDTVSLKDALDNEWVSSFRNYKVLLNVDLTEYNELNSKFQHFFGFFGYDFKLVIELLNSSKKLKTWAKNHGNNEGVVRGCLTQTMKYLKLRKAFVLSHEKKFEVANKILDHRQDKKCILFSNTIKDAEKFRDRAYILHSKRKPKENKQVIETFNSLDIATLSTSKSADAGLDVKGLSVGIILSGDSSTIRTTQRIGRVVRREEGKIAEIFSLVIANTPDELWFNNSNKNQQYITINEEQLDIILSGEEVSTRPKRGLVDIENRY